MSTLARYAEHAEKRFDEVWGALLFPHWWGIQVWRFLTKYTRRTPATYARDYYVLGFVEGAEKAMDDARKAKAAE